MTASYKNTTFTPLDNGQTFVGERDDVSDFTTSVTLVKAFTDCVVGHEYSSDGSTWDLVTQFAVVADVAQACRSQISGRYFRVTCNNNSGFNQDYLRLETSYKYSSDPSAISQVQVTELPAVEIKANQKVGISGFDTDITVSSVGSLPDINLAAGSTIGVSSLPDVTLAAGTSIGVSSLPDVTLAAGTSIGVSSLPDVNLAAGTSIGVSSLPNVSLEAGSHLDVEYRYGLKCHRSLDYNATGQLINAGACRLYGLCIQNLSGNDDCYVKLYNHADAPTSTETPFATYYIKAENTVNIQIPQGIALTLGLGIRSTTALADNDNVNPGGLCIGTVHWL